MQIVVIFFLLFVECRVKYIFVFKNNNILILNITSFSIFVQMELLVLMEYSDMVGENTYTEYVGFIRSIRTYEFNL